MPSQKLFLVISCILIIGMVARLSICPSSILTNISYVVESRRNIYGSDVNKRVVFNNRHFNLALSLNPFNASAMRGTLLTYNLSLPEIERIDEYFSEKRKIRDPVGYFWLGHNYNELQYENAAIMRWRIAKSENWFLANAIEYLNNGNIQIAQNYVGIALRLDPKNHLAWLVKGKIFKELDQIDKAEDAFSQAFNLQPDSLDVLLTYSNFLLLNRKSPELANQLVKKAISLSTASPHALTLLAWSYELLGDVEIAELYYRKAMEERPIHGNAAVRLGSLLFRADRITESGMIFSDLLKDTKSNLDMQSLATIQWWQGRVFLKVGEYRDAEAMFKAAIELEPTETEFRISLIKLYIESKSNERAIIEAFKLLQFAPDNIFAQCVVGFKNDACQ